MTREQEALAVQHVLNGETDYFEQLVLAYQDPAYSITLELLQDVTLTQQFVEQLFLSAFDELESFNGEDRFSVWFYRILLREIQTTGSFLKNDKVNTDNHYESRYAVSSSFIDPLKRDEKFVLLLREVALLNYPEISAVTGKNRDAVLKILQHARETLYTQTSVTGGINGLFGL